MGGIQVETGLGVAGWGSKDPKGRRERRTVRALVLPIKEQRNDAAAPFGELRRDTFFFRKSVKQVRIRTLSAIPRTEEEA